MIESTARAERINLLPSSNAPSFTWEVPQKPVSVRITLEMIDRLEQEAVENFRSLSALGSEIGGLLLGSVAPGSPLVVSIADYELLACDYSRGPLYRLSDADMVRFERAVEQRTVVGGLRVVGFFRSHTRKGLSLDADDLAFFDTRFREPHAVALLIRPFASKASTAGIFIRENGKTRGEASYLEFPFRSSLLAPSKAPESSAAGAGSPPAAAPAPPPATKPPARAQIVPIAPRRDAASSQPAETAAPERPAPFAAAPPPPEVKSAPPETARTETRPAATARPAEVVKPAAPEKAAVPEKPPAPAESAAKVEKTEKFEKAAAPAKPAPAPAVAKPSAATARTAAPDKAAVPEKPAVADKAPAAKPEKPASADKTAAAVATKVAVPDKAVAPKTAPPAKKEAAVAAAVEVPAPKGSKAVKLVLAVLFTLVAFVVLVVYPGVLYRGFRRPVPTAGQETSPLSLRAEHAGADWMLTWNRDADIVKNATRAVLSISDGDRHEDFNMDLNQFRSGSIQYTPATSDVSFRFQVTGRDPSKPVTDSVRVLNPRPSPMADQPASPADKGAGKPNTPAPAATDKNSTPSEEPAAPAQDAAPTKSANPVKAFNTDSLAQRLRPVTRTVADLPEAPSLASGSTAGPGSVPGLGSMVAPSPAAAPPPTNPSAGQSKGAQSGKAGGQIHQAEIVYKKEPEFPRLARETGAKGAVELIATIGTDGKVKKVKVVSGHPLLVRAAQDAVMQWVYKPTLLNGTPVETDTRVVIDFRAER